MADKSVIYQPFFKTRTFSLLQVKYWMETAGKKTVSTFFDLYSHLKLVRHRFPVVSWNHSPLWMFYRLKPSSLILAFASGTLCERFGGRSGISSDINQQIKALETRMLASATHRDENALSKCRQQRRLWLKDGWHCKNCWSRFPVFQHKIENV